MNGMNGIIHFIKKELIIAIVTSIIFALSFYLYQSQKGFSKQDEISSLKETIIQEKNKLKKEIKEYKKEKEFEERVIKGLKIIDKPMTLDIYKTASKLKELMFTYFGTKNIKISYTPQKLKVKGIKHFVFYKVDMIIPYINKYQIISFFDYLNKNYFYIIHSVSYDTKNQQFKISIYLLGKKGKERKHKR